MGPKNKFTKDQIIDVAFNIACVDGIENITIRKVAEKLGSSVAPIYVNFQDGEELLQAVIQKAHEIALRMTKERYTDMPFLNIGIGSLRFAKQYSVLFKDFALKKIDCNDPDINEREIMLNQMKEDSMLIGFSDNELLDLLLKMSIFTHGLSLMTANNALPGIYDEDMLIKLLEDTGKDIIMAARLKKKGELLCE